MSLSREDAGNGGYGGNGFTRRNEEAETNGYASYGRPACLCRQSPAVRATRTSCGSVAPLLLLNRFLLSLRSLLQRDVRKGAVDRLGQEEGTMSDDAASAGTTELQFDRVAEPGGSPAGGGSCGMTDSMTADGWSASWKTSWSAAMSRRPVAGASPVPALRA